MLIWLTSSSSSPRGLRWSYSVAARWPRLHCTPPEVCRWSVVVHTDLIDPPTAGLTRRSLLFTARWSPKHQLDVASECLVGWRLLLEPDNMTEDSVSAVRYNVGFYATLIQARAPCCVYLANVLELLTGNRTKFRLGEYVNPLKGRDVNWLHLAIQV